MRDVKAVSSFWCLLHFTRHLPPPYILSSSSSSRRGFCLLLTCRKPCPCLPVASLVLSCMLSVRDRAWGTRYDTLSSPPPTSPLVQAFPTPAATPISLSPSLEPNTMDQKSSIQASIQSSDTRKMPHDASVFVGSLPSNIDCIELTQLLRDHLSQHAEVKSVKVVRDPSKGATCAFVQCENAAAAAQLIGTLQASPPRPFLGRTLRYEPARAFRTLLISFRRHMKSKAFGGQTQTFTQVDDQGQEADLPTAMRIYKPTNKRFLEILYDDEARLFLPVVPSQHNEAHSSQFDGSGMLFEELSFDVQNLRNIALAFGPIEHFVAYVPTMDATGEGDGYGTMKSPPRPYPHDNCQIGMDSNIWEVKWAHRDDCVNALMTLRRVPFVNISWAHHATPIMTGSIRAGRADQAFKAHPFSPHKRAQSHPAASPFLIAESPGVTETSLPDHWTTRQTHTRTSTAPLMENAAPISPPCPLDHSTPPLRSASSAGRAPGQCRDYPDIVHDRHQKLSSNSLRLFGDQRANDIAKECGGRSCSLRSDEPLASDRLDRRGGSDVLTSPPPLSVNPAHVVRPYSRSGVRPETPSLPCPDHSTLSTAYPYLTDKSPITPPSQGGSTTPCTPQASGTSLAALRSREGTFAAAPSPCSSGDYPVTSEYKEAPNKAPAPVLDKHEWSTDTESHVDPTTIFVGGLNVYSDNAWDESHLRSLFSKYGHIENIQVVRPLNKKSAFAFVKFREAEAASNAVQDEHNQIHNGRQIRVQFRDHNATQRGSWRQTFPRGRIPSGSNRSPFRSDRWQSLHPDDTHESGSHSRLCAQFPLQDLSRPATPTRIPFTTPNHSPMPKVPKPEGERCRASPVDGPPSLSNPMNKAAPGLSHDDRLRTAAPTTPAPSVSSIGPSASAAGTPQPQANTIHGVNYFAPPWVHAYPPYPYPVPLIPGFPGMIPPSHPLPPQYTTGLDVPGGLQPVWQRSEHRHGAPPMAFPPPLYHEQVDSRTIQADHKPPLRPTGFIQGLHGMLIPVYQPEALHRYMSGSEHSQIPAHGAPPPPPTPTWLQPPQLPFLPYAVPLPTATPAASQHLQEYPQRGWIPSPAPRDMSARHPATSSQRPVPLLLPHSGSFGGAGTYHGMYPGPSFTVPRQNHHNTPPPRRTNRRESMHANSFQRS